MPPAPKTPDHVILEIVKRYEIFDKKNKILSKKNGPWEEAIVDFRKAGFQELTVHNLYMKFQGSISRQKNYKVLREQYLHSSEMESANEDINTHDSSDLRIIDNDHNATNISSSRLAQPEVEELQEEKSEGINDGESVRQLKSVTKYSEIIRQISEKKFQLLYTAPKQYSLWKKFIVQSNLTCVLTAICDITQRFRIKNVYESEDDCLSMLCVKVKTSVDEVQIVKLSQALSEKTEFCFLVKFLMDLLKKVHPFSQFLTRYSSILTNSSCFAFHCMTIQMYNSICHKFLLSDQGSLPKTKIKVDIITVLYSFKSRSKFQQISSKSIKEIFLNLIILLSDFGNYSRLRS